MFEISHASIDALPVLVVRHHLIFCCFHSFSGGYFNPAITLGVVLSRGISVTLAILCFVMQILGSLLGAAFTRVRVKNIRLSVVAISCTAISCMMPNCTGMDSSKHCAVVYLRALTRILGIF